MSRIDTLESRRVTTPDRRTEQAAMATAAGGSGLVAIGGICVAGLGIAGLATLGAANALPTTLAAIAVIVFGVVLVLQGLSLAARVWRFLAETGGTPTMEGMAGMGGMVAGGIAGIVLGILALLGVVAYILMAVSVIVFGVCLWVSSAATSRVSMVEPAVGPSDRSWLVTQQAVWMTSGMNALVGLAAIVLGIISVVAAAQLVYFGSLVLTLIALLCVGCAALVAGFAVSTRVMTYLSRS
jgi:hypothetical protein